MTRLAIRKKRAEAEVAAWTHPVGTPVDVRRDNGDVLVTKTRSNPWVVSNMAVILVEGIAGGYLLDRVTARKE